jgi:predicted  nucleic acid-binding Zn-ribbon protein
MFESSENPAEVLKNKLSQLTARREELQRLIKDERENIDVDFDSPDYKNMGYTEELRELEPRIAEVEAELKDIDDVAAAQRNLNI